MAKKSVSVPAPKKAVVKTSSAPKNSLTIEKKTAKPAKSVEEKWKKVQTAEGWKRKIAKEHAVPKKKNA